MVNKLKIELCISPGETISPGEIKISGFLSIDDAKVFAQYMKTYLTKHRFNIGVIKWVLRHYASGAENVVGIRSTANAKSVCIFWF